MHLLFSLQLWFLRDGLLGSFLTLLGPHRLVAKLVSVRIDVLVLGSATEVLLGLEFDAVNLGGVRDQLLVSVVPSSASGLLALVDFLLGMPPMMLPSVATRIEALVAEVALEGLLARVDPLVHLVVGLGVEGAAAELFDSCYNVIISL